MQGIRKLFDFRVPRGHYFSDVFILWCFDERFDASELHPFIRILFSILFWLGMKQFNPESSMLRAYIKHRGFKHPDVVKVAGGAKALTSEDEVGRMALRDQVAASIRLHGTPRVALMLHVDCGAYGGSRAFDGLAEEWQIHTKGLLSAGDFLEREFPGLKIELLIADFGGLYAIERPIPALSKAEKSRPFSFIIEEVKTFSEKVKKVVMKIPRGKTLSYTEVARLAGSPRACRAVGNILNKNYDSKIPCHRVIRSDGTPGGYNRGTKKKRKMLHLERAMT